MSEDVPAALAERIGQCSRSDQPAELMAGAGDPLTAMPIPR